MSNSLARIIESVVSGLILTFIVQAVSGVQSWLVMGAVFALGSLATLYVMYQWRGGSALAMRTEDGSVDVGSGRVSGAQLVEMVRGQMASDVVDTVLEVAPQIYPRITVQETCQVMSKAMSGDCLRILEALAPSIQGPLTADDTKRLLSPLMAGDRKAGSIALANKVK